MGLLDSLPPPGPQDMMGMPMGPQPIAINPDSVAIDGEPPAEGDTFVAQVEFTVQSVAPDGKLMSIPTKVNDEPIESTPETTDDGDDAGVANEDDMSDSAAMT